MKFTKILALVVASMMLALALVSCGGGKTGETIDVNVKIIVDGETKTELFNGTVAVGGSNTVLDAAEAACAEAVLDIWFDDSGKYIEGIDEYETKKNDDGTQSFWYSTINNKDVNGDDVLEAGQTVVFTYGASEQTNVNVYVYDENDEIVFEGSVKEGLLEDVLSAVCDGNYELTDDGKAIKDIGDYVTVNDGAFDCYFTYELDGKEVNKYNAAEDEIKGGSTVEFFYHKDAIEE